MSGLVRYIVGQSLRPELDRWLDERGYTVALIPYVDPGELPTYGVVPQAELAALDLAMDPPRVRHWCHPDDGGMIHTVNLAAGESMSTVSHRPAVNCPLCLSLLGAKVPNTEQKENR